MHKNDPGLCLDLIYFSIMFDHKILNIVSSAIEQDFDKQQVYSILYIIGCICSSQTASPP